MPSLAPHVPFLPSSGIRRIFDLASRFENVISLNVGEPDVPVSPHVLAAGIAALERDDTNYTPSGGISALRIEIATKLARDNGIDVEVDQVWVTAGANQALHLAMSLTLAPGDEILIPDPGYANFPMTAHMVHATSVHYPLSAANGFIPSAADIEPLITSRTRVLLLNSPSNPLGAVTPVSAVIELMALAKKHDLWVVSDECYEAFTFGEAHTSPASLDDDDRVFTAFSFSKTYAMTGIRIGYLVTPRGLSNTMSAAQEAILSCINSPAQYSALAALTGSQHDVAAARERYRANRDLAVGVLRELGLPHLVPDGAIYLWIDVSHASGGDVSGWTERFLTESLVAVAPGTAFGARGEGWIRVSLASDPVTLVEGVRRLPRRGSELVEGELEPSPEQALGV